MDPHTHARPDEVRVTHLALDLTVDFSSKTLEGEARLDLHRSAPAAPLLLDASSSLQIDAVRGADGSPRSFHRGPPDPILGTAVRIDLAPDDVSVTLRYRTAPDAAALQWLAPEQTHAGRHPFLFSQGQAILTRSWIPLQDTPGVRQTFEATVHTPATPWLTTVMGADQREPTAPGTTHFRMSLPIPSYLIAIAVGDLAQRELSPRCAVWAEPTRCDAAADEFADVDRMLTTCEGLYGPYRWGRYDVLVLPPSFPFGGMENPCLTFATPTILAGDRSLVALIAHELAHSWSGNLVTNATWDDFWLNEGFTVYVEQRIVEALFGAERARMETALGVQGLRRAIRDLAADDQRLRLDLAGRDPDDGMNPVAYDKGAAFLRRLEQVFDRARFDPFLRSWFGGHAFESATTDDFLAFLDRELLSPHPDLAAQVDVSTWVELPGLPDDLPEPPTPAFDAIDAQRRSYLDGGSAADLGAGAWVTTQWLHFLGGLPDDTPAERLAALDAEHGLTATGNAEILAAWLERNLVAGYSAMPSRLDDRLGAFLSEVGRRKFLEPLYKALKRSPEGSDRARAIYRKARPRYHSIASGTIDQLLGWPA